MAVKAIAIVDTTYPSTSNGTWKCGVRFAPTVPYSNTLSIVVDGLDPGIASVTFKAAVEDAVKAEMENGGVTFGLLDSVRALIPTF